MVIWDTVTFASFEFYIRKIICLVFHNSDQLNSELVGLFIMEFFKFFLK